MTVAVLGSPVVLSELVLIVTVPDAVPEVGVTLHQDLSEDARQYVLLVSMLTVVSDLEDGIVTEASETLSSTGLPVCFTMRVASSLPLTDSNVTYPLLDLNPGFSVTDRTSDDGTPVSNTVIQDAALWFTVIVYSTLAVTLVEILPAAYPVSILAGSNAIISICSWVITNVSLSVPSVLAKTISALRGE